MDALQVVRRKTNKYSHQALIELSANAHVRLVHVYDSYFWEITEELPIIISIPVCFAGVLFGFLGQVQIIVPETGIRLFLGRKKKRADKKSL